MKPLSENLLPAVSKENGREREAGVRREVNELAIRGSESQLAELWERFARAPVEGWFRDEDVESRRKKMGLPSEHVHCFGCSATERSPAASLWLYPRNPGGFAVSNISPTEQRALSDDAYNLLLADFALAVRAAARDDLVIETALIPYRIKLEKDLSYEAIRRLIEFSTAANKQVLNPDDHRRWQDFVIQAHLERTVLDPLTLDKWLSEQGWPAEQRQWMLSSYEAFRSVLYAYDEERLAQCLP
jgi:hypothetical protein